MTAPKVLDTPLAKLHPAEWNPRTIRDERFKNLCASVEADPDFLWRRPILATADGTIYAGNMRYRAAAHLGMKGVPAIVEDVPEQLAKERALRDNAQWGDWNDDQLAEMVYQMAADGSDVKLVGIEEDELARLLGLVGAVEFPALPDGDRSPFRTMTFTVSAEQEETIGEALRRAKDAGPFAAGNENSNGNALARLAEAYT